MVEYVDGSVLAQMGSPDMRTAIGYSLAWPERMAAPVERLDLAAIGRLTFEPPDPLRFPALRLAREALSAAGGAPTVLNAANEVAVQAFLAGRCSFLAIAEVVERALERLSGVGIRSLAEVRQVDQESRRVAAALLDGKS